MTDLRVPTRPTLAGAAWPVQSSARLRAARAILLALVGSALMALSAKLSVPFYPVPMSMQSFTVVVLGAAFGARLGAASMALYLVEGAAGLPVFADTPMHGLGIAYMMGPTGGYLIGFVLAAAIVGYFAERGADRSVAQMLGAMTLGHVVLFVTGFAWLAHLIGPDRAFLGGVLPFILGSVLKILLAALLVPAVWNLMARRR